MARGRGPEGAGSRLPTRVRAPGDLAGFGASEAEGREHAALSVRAPSLPAPEPVVGGGIKRPRGAGTRSLLGEHWGAAPRAGRRAAGVVQTRSGTFYPRPKRLGSGQAASGARLLGPLLFPAVGSVCRLERRV